MERLERQQREIIERERFERQRTTERIWVAVTVFAFLGIISGVIAVTLAVREWVS